MLRPASVGLLFVSIAFAGCFHEDDGGGGDGETTTPPPPPSALGLILEILSYPTTANTTSDILVEWSIAVDGGGNATANMTELRWGNMSVPDPSMANASAYPEMAGTVEGAAVPGMYNASFMHSVNETIYVRAYAEGANGSFWSDEVSIMVELPKGKVETVAIGGAPPATSGPASSYTPSSKTIKLYDGVQWRNADLGNLPHTATVRAGLAGTSGPEPFDTGQITGGQTSKVIYFTKAGTYTYRCNVHPQTMQPATIIVQA